MKEHKIGEIFEYNGEWYQCVESNSCSGCSLFTTECGSSTKDEVFGGCVKARRADNKYVIFKKLEKVGEPHFIEDEIFESGKVYVQNFKVYKDFEGHKPICNDYIIYDWKNRIISIELKQNKEDMEEKKLNLKPFDLDAAKQGKPVCTRDGRRARIICFDRKDNTPIVALIERVNHVEILQCVHNNGKCFHYDTSNNDLMMLTEKKEGWVNVYRDCDGANITKDDNIYSSKEAAMASAQIIDGNSYVATTKINWEE